MSSTPANLLHKIEPSLSLLYIYAFGSFEVHQLLAYEQTIWQTDPLRKPGMKIIADFSHVTELSFELPDLRKQIDLNQRMLDRGYALEPSAVIGRHDYDVTLGELIDLRVHEEVPIVMAAFLTLHEALEWLGLPEAYDQVLQIQRDLQLQAFALRHSRKRPPAPSGPCHPIMLASQQHHCDLL